MHTDAPNVYITSIVHFSVTHVKFLSLHFILEVYQDIRMWHNCSTIIWKMFKYLINIE